MMLTRFEFRLKIVVVKAMKTTPAPATSVGAVSSAIAVHVASRRWLSFFR
jgi:hypothetical protein